MILIVNKIYIFAIYKSVNVLYSSRKHKDFMSETLVIKSPIKFKIYTKG